MPANTPSTALFTDLYELTMAQVAWREGMNRSSTFSLFFRGYPENRSYYAVAGIDFAVSYLESFGFGEPDLAYLRTIKVLDDGFIDHLRSLRFSGSVRAMPEASLAFAGEPVLEVTAPLIEAQIAETALLNTITTHTTLLTKASRVVQAAGGKQVLDMGARRAQGRDASLIAARCALIAGFTATSNVQAGAEHELSVAGTMAHLFIQSFENEIDAFRAYAREFPESTTLLVDTYDTLQGVENAIAVGKEMESRGNRLKAIRLDSGDTAALAIQSRGMLDSAGLDYVQIVASGGLDEFSIEKLVAENVPVDSFGVGTKFVVAADAPYANSVYKLVSYGGRKSGKRSPGKETLPGPKQVFRTIKDGWFAGDIIATEEEDLFHLGSPLLNSAMEDGVRTSPQSTLEEANRRLQSQLEKLPAEHRRLSGASNYPVEISDSLRRLAEETVTDRVERRTN